MVIFFHCFHTVKLCKYCSRFHTEYVLREGWSNQVHKIFFRCHLNPIAGPGATTGDPREFYRNHGGGQEDDLRLHREVRVTCLGAKFDFKCKVTNLICTEQFAVLHMSNILSVAVLYVGKVDWWM